MVTLLSIWFLWGIFSVIFNIVSMRKAKLKVQGLALLLAFFIPPLYWALWTLIGKAKIF